MRFDDSLKTVLAAEATTALGARTAFRQLVDLIGRGRAPATAALLERLEWLRGRVPEPVRLSCARSLALVDAPAPLVGFFADDVPDVAAVALRAARLSSEEWETLLPRLTPHGRGVLSARHDLPPSIDRALISFGGNELLLAYQPATQADPDPAPAAGPPPREDRFEIVDLVRRLEQYQHARATLAGDTIAALPGFSFETDASGIIRWIDATPRGAVIGLSLQHHGAAWKGAAVDGVAAGAFRKRAAFSGARLVVPGGSAIAGDWRIAGVPMFDHASGAFTGMRGTARRPRVEEDAARSSDRSRAVGAEGLRRLVHELRTPTNAIAGFSELIEQELLGPVAPVYRDRATHIRQQVTGLIGAIEDLDLAARIEGKALDVRGGSVAASGLVHRVVGDLAPLATLRGALLVPPPACEGVWSIDSHNAERLLTRLLSTLLSAARVGEHMPMALIAGADTLALTIVPPAAFAERDEAMLLALDDEEATAIEGAPLLGVGFALRLVRNLAAEVGGRFMMTPELITLLLPAIDDARADHASTGTP